MLTGFQLRAARGVLGITREDLGSSIKLNPVTIKKLENKTKNLNYLNCLANTMHQLSEYFIKNNILFQGGDSISLNTCIMQENLGKESLTRFQFKAARIATRLSQEKLGKILGLSQSTLYDFEQKSNTDFISCRKLELKNIIFFFTENGIVFSDYLTVTLTEDPQILLNKEK